MPGKGDYLELKILDGVLGGPDFVRPATAYVALYTGAPSDTGGGTEVSGGWYGRGAGTAGARPPQLPDGRWWRAPPVRGEPFCFWHAPETAEEAAEARRLGGLHRRKKRTVSAIYGFGGLRTTDDQLALLETTVIETMALENSISPNRAGANMVSI